MTGSTASASAVPFGEQVNSADLFAAGLDGRLLFWIAIAFSSFQLVTGFGIPLDKDLLPGVDLASLAGVALLLTAAKIVWDGIRRRPIGNAIVALLTLAGTYGILVYYAGGLPSQVLRAMHVAFLCLVAGGALAAAHPEHRLQRAVGWVLGIIGFLCGLYQWLYCFDLVERTGDLLTQDIVVGTIALAALFILVWRVLGPALPIMAGAFLAYCLLGQYLPAPLDHRG